jgi:hypothetical protein
LRELRGSFTPGCVHWRHPVDSRSRAHGLPGGGPSSPVSIRTRAVVQSTRRLRGLPWPRLPGSLFQHDRGGASLEPTARRCGARGRTRHLPAEQTRPSGQPLPHSPQ